MTDYRQIGERLGTYMRASNPSTRQVQALLADLLGGDELLGPMQEAAGLPGFSTFQIHASRNNGAIHKSAILQPLSRKYLPSVLKSAEEMLDGILLLPKSDDNQPREAKTNNNEIISKKPNKIPLTDNPILPGGVKQYIFKALRPAIGSRRGAWILLLTGAAAGSVWLVSQTGTVQTNKHSSSLDKLRYNSDLHFGAKWLVGKTVKRKPWVQEALNSGKISSISEPGIWEGLPDNAKYISGTLFKDPNPDNLGIETYRMRDSYYFTFTSRDLILDAIKSPWGYWLRGGVVSRGSTCTIKNRAEPGVYAFPDEVEANRTISESLAKARSGEMLPEATIDRPRHLYRFNTSNKRIEKIDGSEASCTGVLEDIANT